MNELTDRYRSSVLPNNFQLSSINRTREILARTYTWRLLAVTRLHVNGQIQK